MPKRKRLPEGEDASDSAATSTPLIDRPKRRRNDTTLVSIRCFIF